MHKFMRITTAIVLPFRRFTNMTNKRLTASLMTAVMTISALQLSIFADKVFAAGEIGRLNGTPYYSFEELVDKLKSNYKEGHVSIDMMNNWNAAGSDDFDRCLEIPSKCNATLNMHGFVFNRTADSEVLLKVTVN